LHLWIQDPDLEWFFSGSGLLYCDFYTLSSEYLFCNLYETGLLLGLASETVSSKKKVGLCCISLIM
jgi:hypothetical protein